MKNDIVIEAWNTVLFDKFIRFRHLIVEGLSSHSNAWFNRNIHRKGSRVLDVGCGFGLQDIFFATCFPGIKIHAINISPNQIRQASELLEHADAETRNAIQFSVADAVDTLPPALRYGTLLFAGDDRGRHVRLRVPRTRDEAEALERAIFDEQSWDSLGDAHPEAPAAVAAAP